MKLPTFVHNCSVCNMAHKIKLTKLKKAKKIGDHNYTHSFKCGNRAVYSRSGDKDATTKKG